MKEKENLTIPSYNSLHTGTLQLLQIAFANDNEEGNEGNDFKKCEQGNVFFPDRKSTRLNSSHMPKSRMPSSA